MRKTLIWIIAVGLSILGVITYIRTLPINSSNVCIGNLRQIYAAKEQWAMANHKANGEQIVISEVNMYIKKSESLACPLGGVYHYNPIGVIPACSGFDRGLLGNKQPHRLPEI